MKTFYNYLTKKRFRLVDSHIGIAGAHLFIKILASYGVTLYIISIGTMKWFRLSWQYHPNSTYYPYYTFYISIFGNILIDTGKEAKRLTRESNEEWMSERKAKKEAAKARIEDIDPEAASFIV